MSKLTFVTQEQCFEKKLDIFEKRGTKAAITDFAIAMWGFVDRCTIDGDSSLKGRTGCYWTRTSGSEDESGDVYIVGIDGRRYGDTINSYDTGARPALPFSSIDEISTNGVSGKFEKDKDGVKYVYDGYYPQTVAKINIQDKLSELLKNDRWNRENKIPQVCTVPNVIYSHRNTIEYKKLDGYRYNGKIYVRMDINKDAKFSNGISYFNGQFVFFEVEPIKRLISEQGKITITEDIIFAGVPFDFTNDYKTENFPRTDIYNFTNNIWARDVENLKLLVKGKTVETDNEPKGGGGKVQRTRKTRLQKLNPDKSQERHKMTTTEELQSYIENGESVLLRGPSGIGKTDRVRTLYPDLVYIKLTNNMFPEKVVGSMNLQTGESIPPGFAKQIILDSATDEERKLVEENIQNIYKVADEVFERSKKSDKKVVILLDELLNVKPEIQSLVYTLVLNRFVEIGKGLKLPDNVVIVATGNPKKYSMVARDLAEPLEKRINHIIDVEPRVGEWIAEYAIPNGVHPQVIGYMLSKYYSTGQSENIEDIGYFYEEPEVGEEHLDRYGQKGRTNDPRGWTQISDTLKNFERDLKEGKFEGIDVEDALRRRIGTKLREEWAEEFYDFYNMPTLTPEEVVAGEYSEEDLPQDINERFACMSALITADEKQVKACRDFIREYCDPEYLATFDICWAGKDEKRIRKIDELEMLNKLNAVTYSAGDTQRYVMNAINAYEKINVAYNENLNNRNNEGRDE